MVTMNSLVKNIIISLLTGTLAYFVSQWIQGPLAIPSGTELFILATSILAVFIGCSLSAVMSKSPKGRSGQSPKRKPAAKPANRPAPVNSAKETGIVKWFNVKKGFGFITRDAGDDIFVHYRNIEGNGRRAIAEGDRVQFVVIDGDKGLQADEVETI
jgi:CspA family cold shock protein